MALSFEKIFALAAAAWGTTSAFGNVINSWLNHKQPPHWSDVVLFMLFSSSRHSFNEKPKSISFLMDKDHIFFWILTFFTKWFLDFNLPSFLPSVPFIICLCLFIHPCNERDPWELQACTLISSCDGAFYKWQNGDKEWHEGRELAVCPCDIFAHVDAAGRHDAFFLPGTYREAHQSASKFNFLYRSECALRSAPPLSSAGWLNCATDCEDTI